MTNRNYDNIIPGRIEYLKHIDPKIIEKSKKSICKDCVKNLGFNGEYYDCKAANEGKSFDVSYKREGLFHPQIESCQEFEKG
jgi:hypothetical protein